jgi:hypothetical protein
MIQIGQTQDDLMAKHTSGLRATGMRRYIQSAGPIRLRFEECTGDLSLTEIHAHYFMGILHFWLCL